MAIVNQYIENDMDQREYLENRFWFNFQRKTKKYFTTSKFRFSVQLIP